MTIKPDLNGHIALVTSASRGIGAAIAIAFAEAGAAIAVNYRERAAEANAVVAEIKDIGGRAIAAAAEMGQHGEAARPPTQPGEQLGDLTRRAAVLREDQNAAMRCEM